MHWMMLVAGFFSSLALAQDHGRIFSSHLRPAGPPWEDSSLTVDCSPRGNDELSCSITFVTLRLRLQPGEVEKELAIQLEELRKDVAEKGLEVALARRCPEPEWVEDVRQGMARERELGRPRSAERTAAWLDACAAGTQARWEAFLRESVRIDSRTCLVDWEQHGPVRMLRGAPLAWRGSSGPSGSCGDAYAHELQREEKHDNLWTWSITRTAGDTSREECSDPELHRKRVFSYRKYPPERACEYVDFGRW